MVGPVGFEPFWALLLLFRAPEADRIACLFEEAHLDPDSIFSGVERFAKEHDRRIGDQRKMIG
jgi:hypothetical protein